MRRDLCSGQNHVFIFIASDLVVGDLRLFICDVTISRVKSLTFTQGDELVNVYTIVEVLINAIVKKSVRWRLGCWRSKCKGG